MFKCIYSLSRPYLCYLLHIATSSRSLRSSSDNHLDVPFARLGTTWSRAFSDSVLWLWNKLSPVIKNMNSLPLFKSQLKIHLFRLVVVLYTYFLFDICL